MALTENGTSPASELPDAGAQLDALTAEGRRPNPADILEFPAYLESVRRQVVEKHPPPIVSTATNAPPPLKRRRPADSLEVVVVLIVAALVLGGVILLGMEAHEEQLGATMTSWGWPF